MVKRFSAYLLLLPAFFLLHNYNEVFGFIPVYQITYSALVIYLLIGICFSVLYLFLRSLPLSTIATFFIFLFILFFAPFHDFFKLITFNTFLSTYTSILVISAILFMLLMYYFFKRPAALAKFSRYLNFLLIVLLTIEILTFTFNAIKPAREQKLIYPQNTLSQQYAPLNQPDSTKPDIYFLVFDEYTNNTILKKKWGFDNSGITDWLTKNEFYVVPESKANYNYTPFSVSSTLNLNYIGPPKETHGNVLVNSLQAIRSLSDNETLGILRKENYTIRFFAPFNNSIERSDIQEYGNNAIMQIYGQTFPARAQRDILWKFKRMSAFMNSLTNPFIARSFNSIGGLTRDTWRTIDNIKSTANPSSHRRPQFVYGHFLITHKPHLFDSTGVPLPAKDVRFTNESLFYTYIQQVKYVNKTIRDLVAYLKEHNKKNSIIIIAGDHGYRAFSMADTPDQFPIFNAIYFPDKNYSTLYDSMSPVNTFRVVFNNFFNQHLPLLKDSSILVKY